MLKAQQNHGGGAAAATGPHPVLFSTQRADTLPHYQTAGTTEWREFIC